MYPQRNKNKPQQPPIRIESTPQENKQFVEDYDIKYILSTEHGLNISGQLIVEGIMDAYSEVERIDEKIEEIERKKTTSNQEASKLRKDLYRLILYRNLIARRWNEFCNDSGIKFEIKPNLVL